MLVMIRDVSVEVTSAIEKMVKILCAFCGRLTVSTMISVEIFNTVDNSSDILFAHAGERCFKQKPCV